jgi:hypothetical protein
MSKTKLWLVNYMFKSEHYLHGWHQLAYPDRQGNDHKRDEAGNQNQQAQLKSNPDAHFEHSGQRPGPIGDEYVLVCSAREELAAAGRRRGSW